MQRYTIVKTVMKSLKSHQRLLIFLLSVLALTCVISPWMALGADWVAARWLVADIRARSVLACF